VVIVGYICNHVIVKTAYLDRLADVTPGTIMVEPGGSAPNVASWLRESGVESELFATTGDDMVGRFVTAELRGSGVRLNVAASGKTPTVVTLATPDGHRRFITDFGGPFVAKLPLPDRAPDWIHVPAFAMYRTDMTESVLEFVGHFLGRSKICVDVNSSRRLVDFGIPRFLAAVRDIAPAAVLMNQEEAATLSSHCNLSELAAVVVVHRGREPSLYFDNGRAYESSAGIVASLPVVDTTGAGEAFAAGFLRDIGRSGTVESAVAAGHSLAQRAVRQLGAQPRGMPADVSRPIDVAASRIESLGPD
jgi:ribokinase